MAALDAQQEWTKFELLAALPREAIRGRARVMFGSEELVGTTKMRDLVNFTADDSDGGGSDCFPRVKRSRHVGVVTLVTETFSLATATRGGRVKLWSIDASPRCVRSIEVGDDRSEVLSIDFSPCREKVVCVSGPVFGRVVKQWSVASGVLSRFCPHVFRGGPEWAKYSPCGKYVLVESDCGSVMQYRAPGVDDLGLAEAMFLLHGEAGGLYSSCGDEIWTVCVDGTASKWSSLDGHLVSSVNVHRQDGVSGFRSLIPAVFSPDGTRIFSVYRLPGRSIAKVTVYSSCEPLCFLRDFEDLALNATFSSGCDMVLVTGNRPLVRTWSATSGECLHTICFHDTLSD